MQLFIKVLFLIVFIPVVTKAQTIKTRVVKGMVVDARTQEPIPYANIGILDTEIGTLSNEDGSFSIKIPIEYQVKNLLFSSVGYKRKSIPLLTISKSSSMQVPLSELVTELDEIIVTSEKIKKRKAVFGNGKSLLLSGIANYDTLYAGSAIALLIDKSQYPSLTYIQSASLYIASNKMPSFKVRMRILSVDSSNGQKPGRDLLNEQIIEQSTIKKGWLKFPIDNVYEIEQEAFYLTFEWILNKEDRKHIDHTIREYMILNPDRIRYDTTIIDGKEIVSETIPTAVAGTYFGTTKSKKDIATLVSYSRSHSFGKWERLAKPLSAKIEMTNYPPDHTSINSDVISAGNSTQEYPVTDRINLWVEDFKEEQNIPGLQLAVLKHDSLVYSNAVGYLDKTNKIETNSSTQFRIASVSKTLTSAGLMNLVSQGKVDLDRSVQYYVPSFPQKKHPITVRQLLSHLGGIRDYYGISWEEELFIQEHYENSTEAVSVFSNDTLVVKPGTQFVYSSFGYILLGAVIESASKQPYLEYMNEEIWKPLNMNSTYGDIADSTMAHKSKFYFFSEEEATPYDLSYSYPSGGLISTSNDLVKFGSSMLADGLLDDSLRNQVFKTQYTSTGKPTGYGLGWYVGEDFNGTKVWYHAGELPSSGSMILIYPEHELVIALLANSPIISDKEDGFSTEIQRLSEIIYNHNGW